MRLQGTEFKIMHSQQFWLWPWQGAGQRVLKTLLFWQNTDFDADSELEGTILTTLESFRRYPAGLCYCHLKKSLNGPCLRVFHAIVSCNRAGLSARFLEYVPLRMYLIQLTFLRAMIFSGRVFSWSVKILRSTDCHGHSEMVRLLRLTVCTFGSVFITFLLDIRPVAQSEL